MLEVRNVSGGYFGHNVLENVSFTVDRGQLFGILGPNGSGKTTLLKIISGLLPAEIGEIVVKGRPLHGYSVKELAKHIAVLPQLSTEMFAYTVKETVSLGRYAHQKGIFQSWSSEDEKIVQEAMALTGVGKFQEKHLQKLSGGERQRVFLAQALAQQPEILLLDEPTNHLDLSYQKDLLDQLKNWTRERGLTVISIFHDVNLAGLYCDKLLLLNDGKTDVLGEPHEVLQEKKIRDVYKTEVVKQPHPYVPQPQMLLLPENRPFGVKLDRSFFRQTDAGIEFRSPVPLKTMAVGVDAGSGIGWHRNIVASNAKGFGPDTVGVFTDKRIGSVTTTEVVESAFVVTASGLTWILIDAILCDEDFFEIMIKAGQNPSCLVIGATQSGRQIDAGPLAEKIAEYLRSNEG